MCRFSVLLLALVALLFVACVSVQSAVVEEQAALAPAGAGAAGALEAAAAAAASVSESVGSGSLVKPKTEKKQAGAGGKKKAAGGKKAGKKAAGPKAAPKAAANKAGPKAAGKKAGGKKAPAATAGAKKSKKAGKRKIVKPVKPVTDKAAPTKSAAPSVKSSAASVSARASGGCSNIPPNPAPGKEFFNCKKQKKFGQCGASFMTDAGNCLRTCGKCSGACTESAPDKTNSCAAQAEWGKCGCSWMKGHCGCTCGKHAGDNDWLYCDDKPKGGGGNPGSGNPGSGNEASNGGIKLTSAIVKASKSLKALGIKSNAVKHPKQPKSVYIVDGGYKGRKAAVVAALKKSGMSSAQVKLGLAIAMQETDEFKGRDATKTGDSTNYSFFNMNRDLIQRLMGKKYDCAKLNKWANLQDATNVLAKCMKTYSVNGCLDWIRGGSTGWKAHQAGKKNCEFDCLGYRRAMASYVAIFDKWPAVMTDDRRVAMDTKYQ